MKILNFIKSLIPSFGSKDVLTQLKTSEQTLNDQVIPSVQRTLSILGNHNFKQKEPVAFNTYFKRNLDVKYSGNYIHGISTALAEVRDNIPVIRKQVESSFASDINKESLNIVRVTLLQFIEALDFVTIYTNRLLTYTINVEAGGRSITDGFVAVTPYELDWVRENFESYVAALNSIAVRKEVLERGLRGLPAVAITETNAENVESVVGLDNIDPLGFAKIGFIPNPFFSYALRKAERQDARYRMVQEEMGRLNYQLRGWETKTKGEGIAPEEKARLEKAIEYTQGRVNDYQSELDRLEDRT